MKLLPLVCLCVLTRSGKTSADETGPAVIKVREGSDVILPCSLSTKQNIEQGYFDWKKAAQKDDGQKEVFLYDAGVHHNDGRDGQSEQFKGRVSHFPDQLKHGNASIIITNTKVNDSGNYTCDFPRLQPERQIFHIELHVGGVLKDRSEENIPGAAQEPYIRVHEAKDWSLLQCEVRAAFPKPKVEWQDASGNIFPAEQTEVSEKGGSFYISVTITATKSSYYHCVVTQEEINHRIYAETYLYFHGAASKPCIYTLEETKDSSRLRCEVRGASPKPKLEWRDSAGNTLPAEETWASESERRFTIETTVTKTDHYHCVVSQEEINRSTDAKIHVYICESPAGWIVGFAFLAVVAVALAVLVVKLCITLKRQKGSPAETTVPLNS